MADCRAGSGLPKGLSLGSGLQQTFTAQGHYLLAVMEDPTDMQDVTCLLPHVVNTLNQFLMHTHTCIHTSTHTCMSKNKTNRVLYDCGLVLNRCIQATQQCFRVHMSSSLIDELASSHATKGYLGGCLTPEVPPVPHHLLALATMPLFSSSSSDESRVAKLCMAACKTTLMLCLDGSCTGFRVYLTWVGSSVHCL